jgi:hypothetical protein
MFPTIYLAILLTRMLSDNHKTTFAGTKWSELVENAQKVLDGKEQ